MARGKKAAKELSPEEKLQQALVPVEEQPYKIPENWCWVRLGNLCTDIQYGYTAKAIFNNNCPKMLRITDIQEGEVDWDRVPNCNIAENDFEKYKLVSNDIVFARTGATTGKSYFVLDPPKAVYASYLIRIRLNSSLNKKYTYYMLQSDIYWKQITELSSGIAQPGVNAAKLQSLVFPLAPFPEQRRIVARIESLFARLDEVKEKAQAVVDGFELRKSAILHKAFTGELTERWRKEHGVGLESWKKTLFDDCLIKMQNGLAKRNGSSGESYVVLRLANLNENGFDTTELREILLDEKEKETYTLLKNDVIMIRVNGSKDNVGRQLLVPDVKKWAFCDHIIRIRYQADILPQYMVLFSKGEYYRSYIKDHMVSSAGQNTISRKGMINLVVPIPKNDEQAEIVHILDDLLEHELQVKQAAETVLNQIDTMKKAILARAFRGELGTNDSVEESAVKLVNSILEK